MSRDLRSDSGFTLIELAVAMLLTSVLLTLVGVFYVNIARSTAAARAARSAMGQTALAIDAVRKAVETASDNDTSRTTTDPAVNVGTATSLSVISYSSSTSTSVAPTRFTFDVGSGYLVETRQSGELAASGYWVFTGATTSRRVAGPFVLASGTPFFSYVDRNGALLDSTSGLRAADLGKVAFVRVTAKVQTTSVSGASDPVVATTSIGLTNVYRDIDASVSLPGLTGGR